MDAVQDALTLALSRFEEGLQTLAQEILADANQRVAAALTVAVALHSPRPRKTREGSAPVPGGGRGARKGGESLPPVHPEPSPEVLRGDQHVATGWCWCDGAGTQNRHMWNKHTEALALFPKPTRRKQMSLPVARCPDHPVRITLAAVPGPRVVADIVAKAKARMKAINLRPL
jgi:hypothetical protein